MFKSFGVYGAEEQMPGEQGEGHNKNGMITASTLEADEATPKMLKRGQNAVDIRISPDVVVA